MSVPIVRNELAAPADRPTLAFHYGGERIAVERSRRSHDVQRVLIKVDPDGRVRVQAPTGASDAEVLQAVKKRGRWIYEQLRTFHAQQEHVTSRQYLSGESHHYLGRRHVLKVIESPNETQQVRLLRGRLEVSLHRKSPEKVRALLLDWYRERASEVFARRLQAMLAQALWVTAAPPLRIQSMQTQWGSCSPSGRITLNPHLVKAPRDCIDYVILHELCHIAEHNHSERFYRLMQQVMPKWETVKARLDGMAAALLNDTSRQP